ncbi:helix-turn-helix transcriptional regulator [Halarchaeum sp. CBA1220]|uniref:ArsR/SmtB family transcription factor n=1 Tax=Halarchaeum sp. CBA1220 TaxID=1853682 RepID=UPI000F3A8F87|nr:helix-turn-helix domain-containing protein [Halarchaeum sp. CBA1220]QLC34526.1 helix-turn-helix transcriptional regulator [Halarchaeum sp. CBA1220]
MGSLFPFQSDVDADTDGSRLLGIEEEAADEVFDALSSQTARTILAAVYEEPRPASDLADAADTSLQNARYHLDGLRDAGLVDVADTWYSERGTEMKVYAPTNDSVVVMAGDEETRSSAFDVLKSLLGSVGAIGVGALLVQALAAPGTVVPTMGSAAGPSSGGDGGGAAGTTTTTSDGFSAMDAGGETTVSATRTATETTAQVSTTTTAGGHAAGPLDAALALLSQPGVAFFVGGLCVLGALVAWSRWR